MPPVPSARLPALPPAGASAALERTATTFLDISTRPLVVSASSTPSYVQDATPTATVDVLLHAPAAVAPLMVVATAAPSGVTCTAGPVFSRANVVSAPAGLASPEALAALDALFGNTDWHSLSYRCSGVPTGLAGTVSFKVNDGGAWAAWASGVAAGGWGDRWR